MKHFILINLIFYKLNFIPAEKVLGSVGLNPAGLLATIDFESVKFFIVKNKFD